MNFKTYLKQNRGKREIIAQQLGTTKNYVNNLATGKVSPGKTLAARIEEITGGQVTRMELLYPAE